ncbi:MAG: nucleotidyltransferase domain-containing protein [Candidatus Methanomethylophilaceae archaeon]|nr:nucleotidyltransferase domain-containing protein [Candidatus Methanomethylophilaceae archaeon]MBR4685819.1 nucleotidyltransferase domain-containing protein [Candidatus Methanomethylophilaceae archaeon]
MEDTDVKIANVMDLESLGRSISPIAKRCNITGVFLFGSRARGDFDENSDYDLVVDVNDDYDIGDHVRFIDDVSKALGHDVDVITRRSLNDDRFSKDVLREMVHVC